MTTTTGRDLVDRADRLAREVARCNLPVDTALWESFDTTAYRLVRELIGPGRDDTGACTSSRATLLHVIHAYPTPLRPPLDVDFSARAARRFVRSNKDEFIARLRAGRPPATDGGGPRRIRSADLDTRSDIVPADPTDPHPLARLATTLGVLADMVSEERRHPGTVDGLSDQAVRDATARVVTWLAVAGRYALRHGPIDDGSRPLAVAQYAERAIDALGGAASAPVQLEAISARAETTGTGLSERLDCALHRWAVEVAEELKRTIPSTQVMANIASVGSLMMATTHRLYGMHPSTTPAELVTLTRDLRGAADALKGAEAAWRTVTTLQRQGRAFGVASFELFDTLRTVMAIPTEPEKMLRAGFDIETSLRSLERGTRDLSWFIEQSREVTGACVNSRLLFAPARGRDNGAHHLRARVRGEYLPIATGRAHGLMEPVARAADLTAHLLVARRHPVPPRADTPAPEHPIPLGR